METKRILWENVKALMIERYGKENLAQTAKESTLAGCPLSLGSLSRIKAQETAVGIDVIDKVAKFFGILPWQLLIEHLDPKNPPVFILDKKQQDFFLRMKSAYKELVQQ